MWKALAPCPLIETDRFCDPGPSLRVLRFVQQEETLLLDRRGLLEKLESSYRRYVKDLQTLEFTEQQLALRAGEYADFLDAHLLWIRSSRLIRGGDIANLPKALLWVINPLNWFGVLQGLGEGIRNPARVFGC
jgi:potassium efflux system protein